MSENKLCPVCNSNAEAFQDYDRNSVFWVCPICGRFEITLSGHKIVNNPHLGSYLFYNSFRDDGLFEYRYHTTLNKETCDEYRKQLEEGDTSNGRPVHMDDSIVDTWYPKTFAERVDKILLYLNSKALHIGQDIYLEHAPLCALFFVDQIEQGPAYNTTVRRKKEECEIEIRYWMQYLVHEGFVTSFPDPELDFDAISLTLTPKGYSRVDELQKYNFSGRNVLVAMQFGDKTKSLREAIRKGITEAGYIAVFIDEVQHNDFITPELLKHIRDSKFVVADLTHQNNGAYFEEGYAMGLGKPVIQLCQKDTKLHFDIAQKNTIMWATEDDIPIRLTNRIKATID